jgi:hypothetical protein
LGIYIDLVRRDLQAMTASGKAIQFRSQASVAAMQEQAQISQEK